MTTTHNQGCQNLWPKKTGHLQALQSIKMIWMVVLLMAFLPMVSAIEIDNIIREKPTAYQTTYPKIQIDNWFGIGETLETFDLSKHTEQCLFDCESIEEIDLTNAGKLVDDIIFKDKQGRNANPSVQLFYSYLENYEEEVTDYNETCLNNDINKCTSKIIGKHNEIRTREITKPYNFEEVLAGHYKLIIKGKISQGQSVDFILTAQGKELTSHAWWSSFWTKRKPVYFNVTWAGTKNQTSSLINISYDSDMQNDFDDIRITLGENIETGYWFYNNTYVDSNSVQVWVNTTELSSVNKTGYVYYGNPAATTTSDISKAFWFGEDFNALDTTNKWYAADPTKYAVQNGVLNCSPALTSNAISGRVNRTEFIMEMRAWTPKVDTDGFYIMPVSGTLGGYDSTMRIHQTTGNVWIGAMGDAGTTLGTAVASLPYRIIFKTNTTINIPTQRIEQDNKTLLGEKITGTAPLAYGGYLTVLRFTSGQGYVDWVYQRRYVESEPVITFGAEQASNELAVTLISPANNYNTINSLVNFKCNGTDETALTNLTLIIDDIANFTNITTAKYADITLSRILSEGNHNWTCRVSDGTGLGDPITATARTLLIDSTAPTISIINPVNNSYYWNTTNIKINFTLSDATSTINSCRYNYNGTNYYLNEYCNGTTSVSLQTYINVSSWGKYSAVIYANDSLNNFNSKTNTFFVNELKYESPVLEGIITPITLNLSTNNKQISTGRLNYNGTNYYASITNTAGYNYSLRLNKIAPLVNSQTIYSFYWNITFDDGSSIQSSSYNQTINNIGVDNCTDLLTNYSVLILNYSLKDEETQAVLNGANNDTLVDIDLSINTFGTNNQVLNYSRRYSEDVNPRVCISLNLTTSYSMDVQARYSALQYSPEFNNMKNATINNASVPMNIDLFDLWDADSTLFEIIYKDENLIEVKDALINIQRKYIDEGVFKTVEIPITDENGKTSAQLDLDNIIYTIVVTKNGQVLATFDEISVICQDTLTGDCNLNLNALSSGTSLSDWTNYGSLSLATSFDESTKTITTIFSTTDGSTKTVKINATKFDRFGNTTVCSDSLTSSSGTLTCIVPDSFGNISIVSRIYAENKIMETNSFTISPDPEEYFGNDGYVMALLLVITLPLLLTSSTVLIILGSIIGLIISVVLILIKSNSFFGTGSAIVWLVIAGGIIIWKLTREEGL